MNSRLIGSVLQLDNEDFFFFLGIIDLFYRFFVHFFKRVIRYQEEKKTSSQAYFSKDSVEINRNEKLFRY